MTVAARPAAAAEPSVLDVGVAGHAFDHLGEIGDQAPAAAASGANIIYGNGFGWLYDGLRTPAEMKVASEKAAAYVRDAKHDGIKLAIGYVCATSIVKLPKWDRNWTPAFRAQFKTPPSEWLQRGRDGKPLASWYGGDYQPACMNNPDWRTWEKFAVRQTLEAGYDGIFFDNPTVHPQGCYCEHCMRKFAAFVGQPGASVDEARKLATERSADFLRFRAKIAADFIAEMREYARTVKPDALITCNNSLNAPQAFYDQCRTYAYDIDELSKAEDWIVVEDMASQPRVNPDGKTVEYGGTYELLHAIAHGKPVAAITIVDGDYHTPPNLMRLAMAEAAAHGASYLSWPTWPADQRKRMADAVRPEAEFLRENAALLNGTTSRADVLVYLPFSHWVQTADCAPMRIAQALTAANVQFMVPAEGEFVKAVEAKRGGAVVVESRDAIHEADKAALEKFEAGGGTVVEAKGNWLPQARAAVKEPGVVVHGPATVRAVVRDQAGKAIVHLLNLNAKRLSSFEDAVTPAEKVTVEVRVPFLVRRVRSLSADPDGAQGDLAFEKRGEDVIAIEVPKVVLSTLLVVE